MAILLIFINFVAMNNRLSILRAVAVMALMSSAGGVWSKTVAPVTHPVEKTVDTGNDYLVKGLKLLSAGNLEEAASNLELALPLVEKFSAEYEAVLENLCNIYMTTGDDVNVNRLLGLMDEHNQHELTKECATPECHLERAEYYIATGDAAHAKDEYLAVFAMPLSESQKAESYSRYARFLTSQNDYAQAGEYYAMASDALDVTVGVSRQSVALRRLAGMCYFLGKEFDKSLDAHQKVIEAVDEYGYDEKFKISSLEELGKAYKAKKDYSKSKECYEHLKNYLLTVGLGRTADYAKATEGLATVEKFNKEYDDAIAHYQEAIDLYRELNKHDAAAQAEAGLKMAVLCSGSTPEDLPEADTTAEQQRAEKLKELLTASLAGLKQGGEYRGKLSKARTLATIAGCEGQLEEYDKCIEYYSLYLCTVREALMEDFLLKTPKERELTWRRELTNINEIGALMSEVPSKSPAQLSRLYTILYDGQLISKGILLSSGVEFDKMLNRYGTPAMKSAYEQIKSNLIKLESMRQQGKPVGEILELIRETESMQLNLARESATKGVYTDFLRYTTADVARALTDKEMAVEFVRLATGTVPSADMIAAVLVCKEYPTGVGVPVGTVAQLNDMIADRDKFAKDVYGEKVWGNILKTVPGKSRIYFAPDGVLHNVGIEYLSYGGKPLSEQLEMCRVSSTRELCREHKSEPLRLAALFGEIDYSGEVAQDSHGVRESDGEAFAPLAHTGREIAGIGETLKMKYKDCVVKPYSGTDATKSVFLSEDMENVNLLHIATHGAFLASQKSTESDAMSNSILAFAGANLYDDIADNEGVVNADEIAGMSLHRCDMVVLSACESGLGKLGNDGVFGLQRGFKNAGARSLLVSLNKVADEATADMMITFYNHFIKDGKSKRAALREAQSEIRTKYPNQDTWASFIMIDSF